MSEYEQKFSRVVEWKLTEDKTFAGIASPYGNVDLGGDIVVKGAFTRTLDLMGNERTILWQHDPKSPVGLGIFEDSKDALLLVRGEFKMGMSAAKDAHEAIKERLVKGLSIGYMPVKWEWQKSDEAEGWPIRRLLEVKLYEVSLVTFPANESAVITAVKSAATAKEFWTSEIKAGRLDRSMVCDQLEKLAALLAEKREPAQDAGDPVNNHSLLFDLVTDSKERLYGARETTR